MPLVSVIVPAYETGNYIEKCINSITAQTLKDIEIIVIEQYSSDNTYEKLEMLKNEDSRIHIIRSTKKSTGLARNIGIMASSANYICFVDSDDYIKNTMIEKLYNSIENEKADIGICTCYYENYETGELRQYIFPKEVRGSFALAENKELIHAEGFSYVWTKIFKKSLFFNNKIFFPPIIMSEDLVVSFCAMATAKKIVQVNEALYYYLIYRPKSITNTFNETRITDVKLAFDLIIEYLKSNNLFDAIEKEFEEHAVITLLVLTKRYFWLQNTNYKNKSVFINHLNKIFPRWKERVSANPELLYNYKSLEFLETVISLESKQLLQKKPIIIFSSSKGGQFMLSVLRNHNYNVTAFCDNSKSMHGLQVDGLTVYSPEKAIELYGRDVFFIISAAYKYYFEIKEQLKQFGVSDENIKP